MSAIERLKKYIENVTEQQAEEILKHLEGLTFFDSSELTEEEKKAIEALKRDIEGNGTISIDRLKEDN